MDNERYDENVYIQPEQDYCRRCRKRPIDKSENPDSVLCRDCREELIRLRIPKPLMVTGIIVAIIVILCMGVFVMDFSDSGSVSEVMRFFSSMTKKRLWKKPRKRKKT